MTKKMKRTMKDEGNRTVSNFSLYLEPDTLARMRAFKEDRGMPLAEQVRRAIESWLDEQQKGRTR
jgi:hypothetical protein